MREQLLMRLRQVEGMRSRNRVVETGFRLLERDSRIAGGVLGGGLAYRLFFWSLALAVLAFGALGFAVPADVGSTAQNVSLGESVAATMSKAAEQSQGGRWWLLVTGIWLVIWFAWTLLRALRLVHSRAWQVPSGRVLPRPANLLTLISVPIVFVLVSALTGWVANVMGPLSGVAAFLVGIGVFTVLITLGFSWLPSQPVPLRAHLPGAILLAVSIQVLGAAGEFLVAEELASAEALYGALGLAGTMLFVLFLVGRATVWACEINAVSWEVWHPQPAAGNESAPG